LNGEIVHVVDCQGGAHELAELLKDGLTETVKPDPASARELLDLAMLYLRISVAALG
jgi:hypothetical protein